MSESNEHFTPPDIIAAARTVMGDIDLDPASSAVANTVVRAARYYTADEGGHLQKWQGRVFLNPPGGLTDESWRQVFKKTAGRESCTVSGACGLPPGHQHKSVTSSAKRWWFKLAEHWMSGDIEQAIFIAFSLEMLQTMQIDAPAGLPLPHELPICFPRSRLAYYKLKDGKLVEGSSPPHASFIVYLPNRKVPLDRSNARFQLAFEKFGYTR